MLNRQYKAVIFDLDDTLYPEQQYMLSGFRAVSKYVRTLYNIDVYDELIRLHHAGEPSDIFVAALSRRFKYIEPLLIQKIWEVFRCHFPAIELYPDARIGMALLTAHHLHRGLVTDGYGYCQRNKVDALGLRPLLDSIVFSDDLGGREFWKPASDPFFIISIQMELEPAEMVYVGDDPAVDFLPARQLGMGTIRIQRHDGKHAKTNPPTPSHQPHVTIDSLDLILDALHMLEHSVADFGASSHSHAQPIPTKADSTQTSAQDDPLR